MNERAKRNVNSVRGLNILNAEHHYQKTKYKRSYLTSTILLENEQFFIHITILFTRDQCS